MGKLCGIALVVLLAACGSASHKAAPTSTAQTTTTATVAAVTSTTEGPAITYIHTMTAELDKLRATYSTVAQADLSSVTGDCQTLQEQATELGGMIDRSRPGADDLLAASTDAEAAALSCGQGDYTTMTKNMISLLAAITNARASILLP